MKKALISSLILGTLLMPSLTMAQVSTPATSQQIDDLKATLITLLTQMIADLQAQINQILANQAQAQPVVAQIVAPVVQTPAPVQVPLKILSFTFTDMDNGIYGVDIKTNYPIDPTLTTANGNALVVSEVKNLPIGANCTEPVRSSTQDQIELCNGSRVSFQVGIQVSTTTTTSLKFSDGRGNSASIGYRPRFTN